MADSHPKNYAIVPNRGKTCHPFGLKAQGLANERKNENKHVMKKCHENWELGANGFPCPKRSPMAAGNPSVSQDLYGAVIADADTILGQELDGVGI